MAKGKKVEFWPTFLNGGISALGSVVVLGLAGVTLAAIFGTPDEDEAKTEIRAENVTVQGGAAEVSAMSAPSDGGDFDTRRCAT